MNIKIANMINMAADGEKLIKILNKNGLRIERATWAYMDEAKTWRLLLGSPLLGEIGPREFYEQIQAILKEDDMQLSLADISVVSPSDPLLDELSWD